MEYKARTSSKSLYLGHHQHFLHLLLLLLLLASPPSCTAAQYVDTGINRGDALDGLDHIPGFASIYGSSNLQPTMADNKKDSLTTSIISPGNQEASVENHTPGDITEEYQNKKGDQQPSEGNYKQCPAEFQCKCPAACECPEAKYFNQIKDNLAPFIRQQFRELLKKALDN